MFCRYMATRSIDDLQQPCKSSILASASVDGEQRSSQVVRRVYRELVSDRVLVPLRVRIRSMEEEPVWQYRPLRVC